MTHHLRRLITLVKVRPMPDRRFDPELLRAIVIDAVRRSDCEDENTLHATFFAEAVKDAFRSQRTPRPDWCDDVLGKLPYLRRARGKQTWYYTEGRIVRETVETYVG